MDINKFLLMMIFSLFLTISCKDDSTFTMVESEPAVLINGIESYQQIDKFKIALKNTSFRWEISKTNNQTPSGNRPPLDIQTITIFDYVHLDCSGVLQISFFNDRLMETKFYPIDADKYLKILEKTIDKKLNQNIKIQLQKYTDIMYAIDYKSKKYIAWIDSRLGKEFEQWIKKYS